MDGGGLYVATDSDVANDDGGSGAGVHRTRGWFRAEVVGLEPVRTDGYPASAASDPLVVTQLSALVRTRLQEAAGCLLRRRCWIFRGSLFTGTGPILDGDRPERSESCD